jgi:hypothetical protein
MGIPSPLSFVLGEETCREYVEPPLNSTIPSDKPLWASPVQQSFRRFSLRPSQHSGQATGSFNGLHTKSKFQAVKTHNRNASQPSNAVGNRPTGYHRSLLLATILASILALTCQSPVQANALYFSSTSQSASEIATQGAGPGEWRRGTVLGGAATMEAWFYLLSGTPSLGAIYTEHDFALEDKSLRVGPNEISSLFAGPSNLPVMTASVPVSLNSWHHVAHVYDGAMMSLYLDGVRVAGPVAASGDIGDYPRPQDQGTLDQGGFAGFGAYRRHRETPTTTYSAMLGYVASFRISNYGRYSGARFVPVFDDLPADAGTVVTFQFNDAIGTGVRNLQGYGTNAFSVQTGVRKVDNSSVGSPSIVVAPSFPLPVATITGIAPTGQPNEFLITFNATLGLWTLETTTILNQPGNWNGIGNTMVASLTGNSVTVTTRPENDNRFWRLTTQPAPNP